MGYHIQDFEFELSKKFSEFPLENHDQCIHQNILKNLTSAQGTLFVIRSHHTQHKICENEYS